MCWDSFVMRDLHDGTNTVLETAQVFISWVCLGKSTNLQYQLRRGGPQMLFLIFSFPSRSNCNSHYTFFSLIGLPVFFRLFTFLTLCAPNFFIRRYSLCFSGISYMKNNIRAVTFFLTVVFNFYSISTYNPLFKS